MDKIRNIAIAGHNGTGKTSLTEAVLFNLGVVTRMGKIEEGNTVSDYREDEIKRQMSIDSTLVSVEAEGHRLNLADTPGYADFCADVKYTMKAFDSALIVLDASAGIGVGTETAWAYAREFGMPRMVFLNMMDRESADFDSTVEKLREKWGRDASVVPLQVPVGKEADFRGVADLLENRVFPGGGGAASEIPDELAPVCEEARAAMIEAAAETEDALVEKYLEGEELTEQEIIGGLKSGIRAGKIVPVLCGSATANTGLTRLVSCLIKLMPSPADLPPVKAANPGGEEEIEIARSAEGAPCGFVFKTSNEAHLGNVTFFRMYAGKVPPGTELFNTGKDAAEKINQIFRMTGKAKEEVKEAAAGDIFTTAKLKSTHTGDTLCDRKNRVVIARPEIPEGVASTALIPAAKKDQEKLSFALSKLGEEDPGISVRFDPEFAQTILSGMGDLHLELVVERLKARFGVEVRVESTRIPYRETIRKTAKAQGRYKKQSGGRGQYGDAWLQLDPYSEGEFEFVNKIVGGAIPSKFIPAVEKGVRDSMKKGDLAGYPVINARVTVYDGSYHDVDSSDIAFQIAASMAFRNAYKDAAPVLLEPYAGIEVIIPDEFVGDITSDLNSRRGRVMGIETEEDRKIIKAHVPRAEISRYSADLRSMTQGRGAFRLEFSHYEEVPQQITEKIIAQAAEEKEKNG